MTQRQEQRFQNVIIAHKKKIELRPHIGLVDYHVMQNYSDLNQASVDSGKLPFTQEKQGKYIIREFSHLEDDSAFKWHRDEQNRRVTVLEGEGWKFQFDEHLPFELNKGDKFFIPKGDLHRVIKGNSNLTIKIYKK